VHERTRAAGLVADAASAVKESTSLERLRSLTSDLQQVYHSLSSGRPGGESAPPGGAGSDDDVIDAEFTVS
jgi:molecular chaperone DnaK